jgi:signal peptidase II
VPLLAAVILAFDQWTKGLVEANIPLWDGFAPFPPLASYFQIVHWTNTGASFGLLRGQSSLFVAIALVVIVVVLVYARQLPADNWAVRICLGIQLGGTAGNLVDRLQHAGQVTDFLLFTLPVGDRVYIWPAWNVADGSIVVSVILLALILLKVEGKQSQSRQPSGRLEVANADTGGSRETDSQ